MITFKDRQFFLNGEPILIMAGEVHYFRLDPSEWQDRLTKLKETGLNTVATYVPWVLHEYNQGDFDFTGRYHPHHNLEAFLELCEKNELLVFLRPGPFIMAEMLNEGIPPWVYTKYPEVTPTTFDGKPVPTATLDYLSPNFLEKVYEWYSMVIPFAVKYKAVAIQLDNEVGMLSWVSNSPDLTPAVAGGFIWFLTGNYSYQELLDRYSFTIDDGYLDSFANYDENLKEFLSNIQSPTSSFEIPFHRDLGLYMRERFKNYILTLKDYAEEFGAKDTLFVVNIHGTGGGRAFGYPIGVSQLIATYEEDDTIISGSDIYFGDVEMRNFQDMYMVNGISAATNPYGKPLTCVEFGCGDANYGDDLNGRNRAYSDDFKTRMFLAQGNKLLNYYLFCGGENYRLPNSIDDGMNRIAITGQHHGYAAPISPDGTPNQNYPRLASVIKQHMVLEKTIATSFIKYDSIAYAFIPDYFMTEYLYEKSTTVKEIWDNLQENRNAAWESTIRAFLLMGLKIDTIDIQNNPISSELETLIVSSASYLSAKIQTKLLEYVQNGGNLILQGRVPRFDEEGHPCTILADAFEISNFAYDTSKHKHHIVLQGVGVMNGQKEASSWYYECFDAQNVTPLLQGYATQKPCAILKEIGKGKVVAISCGYKCYFPFYEQLIKLLSIKQSLSHDIQVLGKGVFITETINPENETLLYLMNLDDIDKKFTVFSENTPLFNGRQVHLPKLDALTLPINLNTPWGKILYSTVEIQGISSNSVTFRNTEDFSEIYMFSLTMPVEEDFIEITFSELRRYGYRYRIKTDNRLLGENINIKF